MNVSLIHEFLSKESYWAKGIPYEIVKNSIENSFCFGVFFQEEQVGFARVITDYSTIAYLGDVFILQQHRGKKLSKLLMESIMTHPRLQRLRRWILLTSDAHDLYRQFGWNDISKPERYMEIAHTNFYINPSHNHPFG